MSDLEAPHAASEKETSAILRVTTNQGIEDIAVAELIDLLGAAGIPAVPATFASGLQGVVMLSLDTSKLQTGGPSPDGVCDAVWRAISSARSIYHAVVHTGEVEWTGEDPDGLARRIAAVPFLRMVHAESFRVSCSRVGDHPFQSPDVEVAVGTALQQKYGTAVDLEHYQVNVRVDIVGSRCLCGYQLTGRKGLDRRHRWVYHPRVTLRTTVAHAMLTIAGFAERPGAVHDPFCGSGTILLEAAHLAGNAGLSRPAGIGPVGEGEGTEVRITGSDWSATAVEGCRANLDAAGLADRVTVERLDARELSGRITPESLDYIVTNPPFGIRLGHAADLGALYRDFLDEAAVVLRPGGVLALLVGKRRGRFNKVLQATAEFRLEHVRIIEIGGVFPGLFVLRKVGGAHS